MKTSLSVFFVISLIVCGVLWYNLDATRSELHVATTQLAITQTQLNITNNELINTKTQLANTENQLDFMQNQLASTEAQLTTTKNQLKETESRISGIQTQLKTTQDEKAQMLAQYTGLRGQIDLKLGEGEDSKKYITPDDVSVSAKTKEITGGYSEDNNERWRDYKRLYDWVVKNIKYSYDSDLPILPQDLSGQITWVQECWRMPEETLKDNTGDCEDMAVLLATMMLNYNQEKYGVWVITIHYENGGHAAVALPVAGNHLAILDPAGNYFTGYQSGWLQSFDVDKAINDWLSQWKQNKPDVVIDYIFSNDFYKDFANTQEFIDWVKSQSN